MVIFRKMKIHVLNGDALGDRFPEVLSSNPIICRECLIEGPVSHRISDLFFDARKSYLTQRFPESGLDYEKDVLTEIEKLIHYKSANEINLWFEDDLFCQLNFWFLITLLKQQKYPGRLYLVRPDNDLEKGFGGSDNVALIDCYKNRLLLEDSLIADIVSIWEAYAQRDLDSLKRNCEKAHKTYTFISNAIQALINHKFLANEGHVYSTLRKIINEVGSREISVVYPIFSTALPVYGFGDLQVQKLIDDISEQ